MKNLLSLMDVDKKKIDELIKKSVEIKKKPKNFSKKLLGKTLLMFFEKPSLRTRLSFELAITQLGGNAIVVDVGSTPLGKKESIEDTAKVCSRYVHGIMARLFEHEMIKKLATNATIPVINGLTNDFHPCQILSDLLTIYEKKGKFSGLKICYLGDALNNVTHDLIIGCMMMGMNVSIGCPTEMMPKKEIVEFAKKVSTCGELTITQDAKEAIKDADIVYADSWMSYQVDPKLADKRIKMLMPYQVNKEIIKYCKKDYIFMNCLPAMRGMEQTAEIIDGKNSVVFDEAENRLHMQKAILLDMME